MKPFDIVVAFDSKKGIGRAGTLPWHLPGDMKQFKQITESAGSAAKKNAVLMGRKTWESLPEKFRPLPRRLNVVLTHNDSLTFPDGVLKAQSLAQALSLFDRRPLKDSIESIFVIGGGQIFQEAVVNPLCRKIYATEILADFHCDVFFPDVKDSFKESFSSAHFTENSVKYFFTVYARL